MGEDVNRLEYMSISADDELTSLAEQLDGRFHYYQERKDNIYHIELKIEKKNEEAIDFISEAIANFILTKHKPKILAKLLNTNYSYFFVTEKKRILCSFSNIEDMEEERDILVNTIGEYLTSNQDIYIDGFVTFRIKEFTKYLEYILDEAVEKFLVEKEYDEFIKLLKFFVNIQEPKENIVHVICLPNKHYSLLNEEREEITNENIIEYIKESVDGEMNFDDFLISSLITLAPKKIVFHKKERVTNMELLKTITNVFENKIEFCNGCSLCSDDTTFQTTPKNYFLFP